MGTGSKSKGWYSRHMQTPRINTIQVIQEFLHVSSVCSSMESDMQNAVRMVEPRFQETKRAIAPHTKMFQSAPVPNAVYSLPPNGGQ